MHFLIALLFNFVLATQPTQNRNSIRDTYVCSQEEMNCQQIISHLIRYSKKSVKISNGPVDNDFVEIAFHEIADTRNIEAIVIQNKPNDMDFLVGNNIETFFDPHKKLSKYIIVDDSLVITGTFTFTGKNGKNAEVIEIVNNKTVADVYINEFTKHLFHSLRIIGNDPD